MTGCRNCEQRTDGDCGAHGPTVTFTPVGPHVVGLVVPAPGVGGVMPCGPEALAAIHRAPLEAEVARLTAELAVAVAACKENAAAVRGSTEDFYQACKTRDAALAALQVIAAGDPALPAALALLRAEQIAVAALAGEQWGNPMAELRELRAQLAAERERSNCGISDAGRVAGAACRIGQHRDPDGVLLGCRACGDVEVTRQLHAEREARAAAEAREGRLRELAREWHERGCENCGGVDSVSKAHAAFVVALAEPADDSALRAHVSAAVRDAVGRVVAAADAAYRKGTVGDAECQTIVDAVEAAAQHGVVPRSP